MSLFRIGTAYLLIVLTSALCVPASALEIQQIIEGNQYADIFAEANGLLIDNDGVIYVPSRVKGQLLKIADGKIESFELSPRIFKESRLGGVDVLSNGNLVIVNEGAAKLAILDSNYQPVIQFSQSGQEPGELDEPRPVAVSVNNNIYVGDSGNKQITVFNDQGLFLHSFGRHESGGNDIQNPTHISLDADENIYVLESDQVSIFDLKGNMLDRLTAIDLADELGVTPELTAMTVDLNGTLYLGDAVGSQVILFDWRNRKVISKFGVLGQSRTQYLRITELSVNNRGQIAILDSENKKVEVFQLDEKQFAMPKKTDLIRYAGQQDSSCYSIHTVNSEKNLCIKADRKGIVMLDADGEELGEFAVEIKEPKTLHSDGRTVAILEGNNLHVYDVTGSIIFTLGRFGSATGGFINPQYVFVKNNRYYVSDIGNNRIQVFSGDGQFVEEINSGQDGKELFTKVGPVVVDSQSRLYIADNGKAGLIKVLDKDRSLIASIGVEEKSIHKITQFHALDIDKQDRLYLLAGSEFNGFEVSIYNNFKLYKKFGGAGNNGSDIYFEEVGSLSVVSAETNSIHINDTELKRHYRFELFEYPDPVFGLKVAANRTQLDLSWSNSRSPLIVAFEIQAARTKHGPFKTIASTTEASATLSIDEVGDNHWFQVVSVSGHGLRATPSIARENQFHKMTTLYNSGEHAQVVKIADKLLKIVPNNADARDLLGQSLFALKDYTRAISVYKALEENDEYWNKAINYQVQAYFELGQYLDARGLIDQVLDTEPEQVEPYLVCTRLSLKLDDAIGAVTCAEDGLALHESNSELRYLLGHSYIAAGLEEEGLKTFDKLVEKNPDDLGARIKIADDLYRLGSFELALQHYDYVSQKESNSGSALVGKSRSLIKLDRDEEARTIAVKLSGIKATKGDGNYLLGKISAKQGEFKKAVLRLTRAGKEKPELVDAWITLAEAYKQLNQLDKAAKSLEQGIKSNQEAYQLYQFAGQVHLENEKYPAANAHLDRAVTLQPSSLLARKLYARGLFTTRNYRSAAIHAEAAARIAPKDIDVLKLQADIANQQGKTGSAIEFLKTAIKIEPASPDLQFQIGRVYQDANFFDASREHLEKAAIINPAWAAPHVALGNLYSKRRLFDEAIGAFEKAIELDPSVENRAILNVAYADRKNSLEFANNTPQLVLFDLNLQTVFSAAYKKYQDKAIGSVKLKNVGDTEYGNLKLSFQIKEYMDFPTSFEIGSIAGNETREFDIKATFTNKILEVDEDTGVQVEVKLTYLRDGQKDDITLTQPMTIYGKNAIIWGNSAMVGSFVTPKDDTLRDYVRQVVNTYQPEPGPLNENMVAAMAYFSGLTASGTKYIIDPNTPFTELGENQIDYVQFPRETLRLKSGDCDDLSVLISAGLENLGIKTAFLEIPGHLFMMFDTGLPAVDAGLISQDDSLIVVKDGNVWIPLEATMVNTSFIEAWAEGSRKYHNAFAANELGIIDLHQAWQQYKPVTLSKASYSISLPEKKRTSSLVKQAQTVLLSKSIHRLVLPYQAMVASNPRNIAARLQIAILYARFGLFEDAEIAFEALSELAPENSAVYTNQGNLYFLQEEYDLAVKNYLRAVDLDGGDGGIWVNLSMAQYKAGDLKQAGLSYQRATQLDPDLSQEYESYAKLLSQ